MTLLFLGIFVLVAVAILAFAAFRTSRKAYESAPYQVVRKEDHFEVRDYPSLTVIETPMSPTANSADGSFIRLFRFITGQNKAKEKIPMTTPVFMSGSGEEETMSFVLPATFNIKKAPQPLDGTVKVRVLPAGRFGILRFGGGRSSRLESESLTKLIAWMKEQGLCGSPTPIYAYFDPPWTPGFMRRNEVMLRILN